jgi:hypothetical protein
MTRWRRVMVFLFALNLLASVASADNNTIPRYFDFKFGGDPLWISASEAITATGTLRPDIRRSEHLKHRIAEWHERQAAEKGVASDAQNRAGESCDVTYGHYFNEGPDEGAITSAETLREIVATRSVITGTVTASALGIHDGIPYTILQIDDEAANRRYLMYPKGRLRFEGMTFCNDDPSFFELPATGDPILFIASDAVDSTGTLFTTSWVVYEHDSAVVTSRSLQLEPDARPKSIRGFAKTLRAAQQGDKQQ